jgi:hypothetical protein
MHSSPQWTLEKARKTAICCAVAAVVDLLLAFFWLASWPPGPMSSRQAAAFVGFVAAPLALSAGVAALAYLCAYVERVAEWRGVGQGLLLVGIAVYAYGVCFLPAQAWISRAAAYDQQHGKPQWVKRDGTWTKEVVASGPWVQGVRSAETRVKRLIGISDPPVPTAPLVTAKPKPVRSPVGKVSEIKPPPKPSKPADSTPPSDWIYWGQPKPEEEPEVFPTVSLHRPGEPDPEIRVSPAAPSSRSTYRHAAEAEKVPHLPRPTKKGKPRSPRRKG